MIYTFDSSYALFHACRKTFSNVKSSISEEWRPPEFDGNTTGFPIFAPFHNCEVMKTIQLPTLKPPK